MASSPVYMPQVPGNFPQYNPYQPLNGDRTFQKTQGGSNYVGAQPFQLPPFMQTEDPSNWAENERMRATGMANQWDQQFGGQAGDYQGGESGYGQTVQDLYSPIWNGGGGYTSDQMQNVLQSGGLSDIQNQLPSNYLTQSEQEGISGNPYGAFDYAAQPLSDVSSQLKSSYSNAINPAQLSQSSGYTQGVGGALARGSTAIQDPGLNITPDYLRQANLSDQEVSNLAASAGADVGAQYQSNIARLQRQAAATGANPLAVGGLAEEMLQSSAGDTADAMNKARMNARLAQAQQAQNVQNTQLGAAGTRAGLGLNYMGADISALTQEEQQRLGAQQDISNRYVQAAQGIAGQDTGATEFQAGQFGTGEAAQSGRAGQIAANRQGISQANQGMQFNINNSLAQRYQQAYQPWLQAQQEGRQAAQQQQQYYGGRTQDTNQLRLQGWQTGQQGTQGALQLKNQVDQISKQPGSGSNIVGNVAKFF